MEDAIQDLVRQKIQEVLRACGIDRYETETVTPGVAAISRFGLSLLIRHTTVVLTQHCLSNTGGIRYYKGTGRPLVDLRRVGCGSKI